jgi:hypothetical protein
LRRWRRARRIIRRHSAELDQAITDAAREYIAVVRARPRNQQRIDEAKAALDDLLALRG